jgi:hypothetical protein
MHPHMPHNSHWHRLRARARARTCARWATARTYILVEAFVHTAAVARGVGHGREHLQVLDEVLQAWQGGERGGRGRVGVAAWKWEWRSGGARTTGTKAHPALMYRATEQSVHTVGSNTSTHTQNKLYAHAHTQACDSAVRFWGNALAPHLHVIGAPEGHHHLAIHRADPPGGARGVVMQIRSHTGPRHLLARAARPRLDGILQWTGGCGCACVYGRGGVGWGTGEDVLVECVSQRARRICRKGKSPPQHQPAMAKQAIRHTCV